MRGPAFMSLLQTDVYTQIPRIHQGTLLAFYLNAVSEHIRLAGKQTAKSSDANVWQNVTVKK